jgi:ribose transport system substrate-binding protein
MIEALGPAGGRISILNYNEIESCILRVKGFREVIAEYNASTTTGRIEIVADISGGAAKDKGYKATEELLQAHPDLNGIFAINDPSALGAHAVIEKAGKAAQIKLIGFDGQPEGKQAIKNGKIYADPIQFPDKIGVETMRAIVRHFARETLPSEILIPTGLYRKADAEKDPALK